MYKIVLCCSAGMATSMLVQSMKEEANKAGYETIIWAVAETAIDLNWAEADCVLVAPQIASAYSRIETMVNGKIPVAMISAEDFSSMNGKIVVQQAINLINQNKK